jgi:hypothetical protein
MTALPVELCAGLDNESGQIIWDINIRTVTALSW